MVSHSISSWIDREGGAIESVARLGYGARGVVYVLLGGLAFAAAMGSRAKEPGSRDALQALITAPFGRVLLGMIAIGLACFAVWRVVEPVFDIDRRGTSWKGLAHRAGHLISAVLHASLCLYAASLSLGWGTGGGDEEQAARDWTAWLMQQPFGPWLVGIVGVGITGAGCAFLWKAWRGNVTEFLDLDGGKRGWVAPVGRFGHGARGIVFVLIGVFLVLAAYQTQPSQARSLGGALNALSQQPYGWMLLAVTALGLLAFGLFGLVQSLYRRVTTASVA